ncbi:MAG: glycosyltransferase family 9 protein [Candidatus Gastranaerophilales bacterium]|nr:glycosyltransferase family 9 protein [Candidatus Gastranaerophilales bacterium]
MEHKKKILIIRLGALGDVVQTTIIADAIKDKHPDYEIHYLVQDDIAPVLKNHPHIDRIIIWSRTERKSFKQLFSIGILLFKEHYDIIFNLTYALRNILLNLMSMSKRVVMRKHSNGLRVETFYLTAKSAIKDLECPNRLHLGIAPEVKQKLKKNIERYSRPYIIFAPGGGTDKNRQGRIWNIKNWKILSEKLQEHCGGTIFVCGSKIERKYHEKLSGENVVIFSGDYNIEESSALFSLGDMMISGDTGPVHIASGHNIKTLAILGSTSPDKIKPYGKNGYYISSNGNCKYCWRKKCPHITADMKYTPCMESITPDMVFKKAIEILSSDKEVAEKSQN